jgi:hypothetical protein
MHHWISRSLSFSISIFLISAQVQAQSSSYLGVQRFSQSPGAEFVSGAEPGTVLMRVNLWGGIHKPGIHHIPVKTDLMSLLSYAGGPKAAALLDEVTIKREVGGSRKLIKVDVQELVQGVSHHHIELAPNDIVVVPEDEPWISNNTLTVVTFVSVIMSTILAASLIDRNQRN